MAKGCPRLRHIEAQNCLKVTDIALTELGCAASNLEYLNVQCCDYITDIGVINLARGASKLRVLNLKGCNELTGFCIPAIVENLKQLTFLDVSMSGVVPAQLLKVSSALPFAAKGQGSTLVAVPTTVHKFNAWLFGFREQMKAANMIQQMVMRYLNRCRYLHLRAHLNATAIQIQRVYRGFKGRKYARWIRNKHIYGPAAAVNIQRIVRGRIGRHRAKAMRRYRELQNASATQMQALARGFLCQQRWRRYKNRQRFIKRRWNRLADTTLRRHRKRIVQRAIIRIECYYAAFKIRRVRQAATLIQRVWRGHTVRVKVWDRKCARLFVTNRAATIINNGCRKMLRRKHWRKRLAAIKLEHRILYEGYQRRVAAATRIQRFYRRTIDKRRLLARSGEMRAKYRVKSAAAVIIQCLVRCHLARRALHRRRIEKIAFRMGIYDKWRVLAKKLFSAKAAIIQRWWRKRQLRYKSATLIQKMFRGYAARRRFIHIKRKWAIEWWLRTCNTVR